jgi:spore coat protein A, manganese oxidase
MKKTHLTLLLTFICVSILPIAIVPTVFSQTTQVLNPLSIPKYVNQLNQAPPIYVPTNVTDKSGKLVRQDYTVSVSQFTEQILPNQTADGTPTGFGPTTVWGYSGEAMDAVTGQALGVVRSTPGSTFEAIQGVPVQVKWVNDLVGADGKPLSYMLPVDPTIHWANPSNMVLDMTSTNVNAPTYPPGYTEAQSPVPIVTHLHGGEIQSTSDGGPTAWFTADGKHGSTYNTVVPTDANAAVDVYPNGQQPTTLWYHDHALGVTRLNVMSGLAGFYLIRNSSDPFERILPHGEYEVPLAIQDRSFLTDGSLYYPTVGNDPSVHPYWQSMFLGNSIIVNGEAWPNMNVKQGEYRFRILDGSNSRFYQLSFSNGMSFTEIGADGGYLKAPVESSSQLIAPGQRIDILVDFSNAPVGTKIILENAGTAQSPADPHTTGQIMQFTVTDEKGFTPQSLPSSLNPTLAGNYPSLPAPDNTRILTLTDVAGADGSTMLLLDGQEWSAPVSEMPKLGSTEDWTIVNPTMAAHPIHVHLVQFQVVSRQNFDIYSYMGAWLQNNGNPPLNHTTVNVASLNSFYTGQPSTPAPNEQGWFDTVVVNIGEAVTIRLRWAEQNGNPFPFDAAAGPGYVWHCHVLEHEDNEMMRPYTVVSSSQTPALNLNLELAIAAIVVVVVAVLVLLLIFRRSRGHSEKRKV